MPDKGSTANPPDVEITLHYIDKLFTSYRDMVTAHSRIILTRTMLALLLLAVSGGVVSAKGELSIAGFGVRVPLTIFLTGGTVFVGSSVALGRGMVSQTIQMRREIVRLYTRIGFQDRTMYGRVINPFRIASLLNIWTSSAVENYQSFALDPGPERRQLEKGWGYWILAVVYWGGLLLQGVVIVAAAEIGVGLKLAEILSVRGLGWIWILFVLFAVVTSASDLVGYLGALRMVNVRERLGRIAAFAIPVVVGSYCAAFLLGGMLGYFVIKVLGSG
jgi:hypothetical protein